MVSVDDGFLRARTSLLHLGTMGMIDLSLTGKNWQRQKTAGMNRTHLGAAPPPPPTRQFGGRKKPARSPPGARRLRPTRSAMTRKPTGRSPPEFPAPVFPGIRCNAVSRAQLPDAWR